MTGRSEDDLRAAFAAKATEAPAASDVARAVNQAVHQGPRRRRPAWLVPAVTAAAAVAVGVPLAIVLTSGDNSSHEKAAPAASAPTYAAGGSAGAAAPPDSARRATPQLPGLGSAGSATCRPSDVMVTIRRSGTGATLTVTSRGAACELDRLPTVQWPAGAKSAPGPSTASRPAPKAATGVLAAGASATAIVQSAAACVLPGDVVDVDWGAGPVEVRAEGASAGTNCSQAGTESVQVGEFDGLS